MAASIVTTNLTKIYSDSHIPALNKLSLSVQPGEVYGFLGANGAGKSTTIRLLLNFIQPTSGTAQIAGLDSARDSVAVKKHVGYLAGDVALYNKTTGSALLNYLGKLQGMSNLSYRHTLEKRFEAEVDKPISSLSKGNRQKIGIIQALMHEPDVLILDEPTSGLDPLMQEAFYESIREARARGAAVLMSSHNLTEAQGLCDRIGIIKHGKLIHEQAINAATRLGGTMWRVVLDTPNAVKQLHHAKHFTVVSQQNDTTILLQVKGTLPAALAELSTYHVNELTTQQVSLEDEFISYYGDKS